MPTKTSGLTRGGGVGEVQLLSETQRRQRINGYFIKSGRRSLDAIKDANWDNFYRIVAILPDFRGSKECGQRRQTYPQISMHRVVFHSLLTKPYLKNQGFRLLFKT